MANLETFIVVFALIIDALIGDPHILYRRVPHPVVWMGTLIDIVERLCNNSPAHVRISRTVGSVCVIILIGITAAFGWVLQFWFSSYEFGWLLLALIGSFFIAFRSLYDHVLAVATALKISLPAGRIAVSHIVGRDYKLLDESGVCRGAIESAAENFSDGVVAPTFWFICFGLPGLLAYKMVNTLDSMWGHRSCRFQHFGWAAARVDDGVNFLPARLAGCLFVIAALILPAASVRNAWVTMIRDATRHRSPNAGWQEAAIAGALGIAIAGPRQYAGQTVEDAWMGDGRRILGTADIHNTLYLYIIASATLLALTISIAFWGTPIFG